jgi:hypothetical protein
LSARTEIVAGPGRSIDECTVVEICAGSAQLSASFRKLGANTIPFDWKRNRHQTKVTVYQLDLTAPGAFDVLSGLFTEDGIIYVHFAPPCGTASKAREKPVPLKLRKQGAPAPRPLRSQQYPRGLPGLSTVEQQRVDSANTIYELVIQLCYTCKKFSIPMSIENPAGSHFWNYPGMDQCKFDCGLEDIDFDGCMHGGSRARLCRWRATIGLLSPLAVRCDNSHQHKPWTMGRTSDKWTFSTAEEAAYPSVLTDRVATLVLSFLGIKLPVNQSLDDDKNNPFLVSLQAGKQPKGHKIAHLISEFREVVKCKVAAMPQGAKRLRDIPDGIEGRDYIMAGIYRTPTEYIDEARSKLHPIDYVNSLDENLLQTISFALSQSPVELSRHRLKQLNYAISKAKELEPEEEKLHAELEPFVASILRGKRLLLFKHLLELSGYPDCELLFKDIKDGFDVVGCTSTSGCLRRQIRPATTSTADLQRSAVWNRRALMAKCKDTGNAEQDLLLWNETLQEVQRGWLRGPYTEQQVSEILQTQNWICARRFPIVQGPKTRLIDDCREPQLNTALRTTEKLGLMGIDHFSILAMAIARQLQDPGTHAEWLSEDISLKGRTLDLKSAYKNLACSPRTRWASVIMTWNPEQKCPAFYISDALMFGSTSAVYAFNRCARAMWFISVVWMKNFATQFYDDFPCIDFSVTSTSAKNSFEGLLTLLGWKLAEGEHKVFPFDHSFKMLGVLVDLQQLTKGVLTISNTESRVKDILQSIEDILKEKLLKPAVAATLFGRLGFALTSVFGRGAAPGMKFLSKVAASNEVITLDEDQCEALSNISFFMKNSKPRVLSLSDDLLPVLVFTDAAAENGSAQYGILLIDRDKRLIAGSQIPQALVSLWLQEVGDQIICQAELFPILLAKYVWSTIFHRRRVLVFVDNEPARFGLIKAESSSLMSQRIIKQFYTLECLCPSVTWFARVPSESNPADMPSRGELSRAAKEFAADIVDLASFELQVVQSVVS